MQIHGASHVHGPQSISSPHRASAPTEPSASPSHAGGVDQLDISQEADMLSRISEVPDIRQDKVADIRKQIAAGTYDTDEKLDLALERLLDEIG